MDLVEIVVLMIPVLAVIGAGLGGLYFAIKKFLKDLVASLEDDVITREELELLIADSLSIVNIFKNLFKKGDK
jgi:hypothetical protein